MAKQMVDEEDTLRRQARRRLIGAVTLVTAVVVVVPLVLDSEPKPVQQNIELRIPDKDKAGGFAPKIDTPVASAALAAPMPALVAVSAPVPVIASTPAPAVTVKPTAAAPVKPAAAALPASATAVKSAAAAPEKSGATAPAGGFVVQIGAFSSAATAHRWQKNLSSQGFKVYTEKAGDKTRVRAGPYPTREAANRAHDRLEAKNLHSNVVELNP